jgi:hypothetical protein
MPRLFGRVLTNKNVQQTNNQQAKQKPKLRIGRCNCGR